MSERPAFNQRDAARECGVSVETIKRRRMMGQFPNSFQSGNRGDWMIPVDDLLAAGLQPGKPSPPDAAVPVIDAEEPKLGELKATVEGLKAQLAEREARVEEAKANAAAQIETMRGQILAIEAGASETKRRAEAADQRVVDLRESARSAVRSAQESTALAERQAVRWQYAAIVAGLLALGSIAAVVAGLLLTPR
jgi:hypothetical protein